MATSRKSSQRDAKSGIKTKTAKKSAKTSTKVPPQKKQNTPAKKKSSKKTGTKSAKTAAGPKADEKKTPAAQPTTTKAKSAKDLRMIRKTSEIKKYVNELRAKKKRIALVPTMGFLHEGHLSLIKEARKRCDEAIVSVFVDPTQFGPSEDLDRYPRDLAGDKRKIRDHGADILFAPEVPEIYPEGFQTVVEVTGVTRDFCGASRPSHFRGVTTVVAKLFQILRPDVAIFGQKDYQQLVTIRRMVHDLDMGINIIGMPTIREEDGLAMSSRNSYLSPAQRVQATAIYRGLRKAQKLCESGEYDAAELAAVVLDLLREQRDLEVEYVAVCDSETLERIPEVERKAVATLTSRPFTVARSKVWAPVIAPPSRTRWCGSPTRTGICCSWSRRD